MAHCESVVHMNFAKCDFKMCENARNSSQSNARMTKIYSPESDEIIICEEDIFRM